MWSTCLKLYGGGQPVDVEWRAFPGRRQPQRRAEHRDRQAASERTYSKCSVHSSRAASVDSGQIRIHGNGLASRRPGVRKPFMTVDSFTFVGPTFGFGHGVRDFSGELFRSEHALEDSIKPFCQGGPGFMNAVSTPAALHHSIRIAAVNSGPWPTFLSGALSPSTRGSPPQALWRGALRP